MNSKKFAHKIGIFIICILINFIGKSAAAHWNWPLWLDMVGTCVAAYFLGPIGAIITGAANNFLYMIWESTEWIYFLVSVVAALAFSFCASKGYFEELAKAAVASFWIGILCVMLSTPINMLLYGGYSGNMWGDALFDMLDWYGLPKVICALAGEAVVEIVDKQVNVLLAYLLIHLGLLLHKRWNKLSKKKVASVGMLLFLMIANVLPVMRVSAAEETCNYLGHVYNNRNGMLSSEANVIAETDDGYIWIGSYAGLTRYDGKSFEFIRDGGITNVTCMLNDRQGRLWIGTNDSGIAKYERGTFTFYTESDGVPSNSIRCFAEGEDGTIYVGTTDSICAFGKNNQITVVGDSLSYIVSLNCYREYLIAVDNTGCLHAISDDEIIHFGGVDAGDVRYTCVTTTGYGLTAGTGGSDVHILEVTEEGILLKYVMQTPWSEIVMMRQDASDNLWICAEAAVGYMDKSGVFYEQYQENFDASFEWIHEDYQGNIWIASSRYGVLKLSATAFIDLFAKAKIPGGVVNAVIPYQGKYYCGSDQGLVIIDAQGRNVKDELTEYLEGNRIRALYADADDNLWVCSYGACGLVRYSTQGQIDNFTMESKQTTSNRFRCATQMADGTMVIGTADGINFIRGDEVVGTIRKEDGLQNSQILTLVTDADGNLYAGSDGGGIYVIRDQKIIDNYTVDDGLSSNVILRMIPYGKNYFVVTSNSLCFMDDKITILTEFPYFNNYDVVVNGEDAYVLSSAGIYVVNAESLRKNDSYEWRLYRANDGLVSGLIANSWNYIDENGALVFCCNSGVTLFSGIQDNQNLKYHYDIKSIICDGKELEQRDGVYTIPSGGKRVVIAPSIRNYSLVDVKTKFYVEGVDDDKELASHQQLEDIQLTNIASGDYSIHFQIWNNAGDTILREKIYTLRKEEQIWENEWYLIYLMCVCVEVVAFTTWTVLIMVNISKRKGELEKQRVILQERVEEQTEQIRVQQEKTESLFMQTVIALSEAVDAKDRYTSGHSKRVAAYSRFLAARMGKSEAEQEEIYCAGLLHDVGKIRVPEDVINKPGKLTEKEFELIKIHPVIGYHILKGISGNKMIALGAKYHHERYDGKGYPNGLEGKHIPEIARIIAVADSYDAMASNRSYRNALPQEVVRSEIEKGCGTQFDPDIAQLMLKLIDEDMTYTMKQTETEKKRVLIVDDEIMNIKLAEHVMKDEAGYRIFTAKSGEEALDILNKTDMDLILLDIRMPQMDGFETLERMRERKIQVPVVFLTADRDSEIIEKATQLGVDDYLTKPFFPLALKEVIRSMTQ